MSQYLINSSSTLSIIALSISTSLVNDDYVRVDYNVFVQDGTTSKHITIYTVGPLIHTFQLKIVNKFGNLNSIKLY